jgi:transcriptional regulator with XRE-family HTH domain
MKSLDDVINRLKQTFNTNKDKEIADLLGVTNQAFANWKNRNKIPYEEIISLCLRENIDLKYIINGEIDEGKIKKLNFREENHKIIEQINDENQEIIYHILQSEKLKLEKL